MCVCVCVCVYVCSASGAHVLFFGLIACSTSRALGAGAGAAPRARTLWRPAALSELGLPDGLAQPLYMLHAPYSAHPSLSC